MSNQFTLQALNSLSETEAQRAFSLCCTATSWIEKMVSRRPFNSIEECHRAAVEIWQTMNEADLLEAFAGHPKIGDVDSLRKKYANTKALASGEQSSVNSADDQTLEALTSGNQQYLDQNGFIFIVCATGKSAKEMLELLQARLSNSRAQELKNAADEQLKITTIRIDKLILTQALS